MFKKLKRFLPIKVHSIKFGYGWWFSDKLFFFEKHWMPVNIMPISIPKPIGTSNNGSKSFLIASQMKKMPTRSMMMLPHSQLAKPVKPQNVSMLWLKKSLKLEPV